MGESKMALVRDVGMAISVVFHMDFREEKPMQSLSTVIFQTVSP